MAYESHKMRIPQFPRREQMCHKRFIIVCKAPLRHAATATTFCVAAEGSKRSEKNRAIILFYARRKARGKLSSTRLKVATRIDVNTDASGRISTQTNIPASASKTLRSHGFFPKKETKTDEMCERAGSQPVSDGRGERRLMFPSFFRSCIIFIFNKNARDFLPPVWTPLLARA